MKSKCNMSLLLYQSPFTHLPMCCYWFHLNEAHETVEKLFWSKRKMWRPEIRHQFPFRVPCAWMRRRASRPRWRTRKTTHMRIDVLTVLFRGIYQELLPQWQHWYPPENFFFPKGKGSDADSLIAIFPSSLFCVSSRRQPMELRRISNKENWFLYLLC